MPPLPESTIRKPGQLKLSNVEGYQVDPRFVHEEVQLTPTGLPVSGFNDDGGLEGGSGGHQSD